MDYNVGKIYIITNDMNNLVYIGQTVQTIEDSLNQHIKMAQSYCHDSKIFKDI